MAGKIEIYKKGCNVSLTNVGTALATTTGTTHYMTAFQPQISVGQRVNYLGVLGTSLLVTAVVDESYNGARRTKIVLNNSSTISANTVLTFTSLDNTFTNTGRVGQESSFIITIERIEGRILSPSPSLSFNGVYSISDYKVVSTDTFENTTELIKRVYVVTHKVPLSKVSHKDILYLKAATEVDLTGTQNKIYGYEILANPPSQSIESITNTAASANKDLTNISFPSKKSINKTAETRLLIVYGDPGATFKLQVDSNTVAVQHASSSVSNQTTLSLQNASNAGLISKGMNIVTMAGGTSITAGVKLASKVTSTTPDTITLNLGQSAASDEIITFGYVLVTANTIRTLNSDGIYAEYIKYPANDSTADITYTAKLTENVANTFIEFSTPSSTTVISLASARNAALFGVYADSGVRTQSKSSQSPVSSTISVSGGLTVTGAAEATSARSA